MAEEGDEIGVGLGLRYRGVGGERETELGDGIGSGIELEEGTWSEEAFEFGGWGLNYLLHLFLKFRFPLISGGGEFDDKGAQPNLSGAAVFSPASSTLMSRASRHPFDSAKWDRVCRFLSMDDVVDKNCIVEPKEATKEDLVVPHVALFPNCLVQQKVLSPPFHNQAIRHPSYIFFLVLSSTKKGRKENKDLLCLYYTAGGGTILATKLAKERGWAINVGGLGFIIVDYEARRFIDQRVEVAVSRGTTTTEYLRKMKLLRLK
ncbi:putative histone deacetylase [Rosa chinensis]|uniref:Putative histone deacetylase n=1 Tax=Rosa chinensis TaxID=74649 RepID=A0A2P6Q9F6_ROSCH|nr:putative histone deacetylase [Rosa chinensis]